MKTHIIILFINVRFTNSLNLLLFYTCFVFSIEMVERVYYDVTIKY